MASFNRTRIPFISILIISVFGTLVLPNELHARQTEGELSGRVVDVAGSPIRGAMVELVEARRGAVSDANGAFRFSRLDTGRYTVVVRMPGYLPTEAEASVRAGEVASIEIVLTVSAYSLDPITVTGTMKQVRVTESPVRVEVVPRAVLDRLSTNNLTETLQFLNGITNQIECGVCYTNSIRINGMEGPYTAVLIDGMPIMSSLASVYGLNGIHPAFIEQVEIIRGPSSTLYGSEAMGGVINVITKDARFAPRFAADLTRSSDAEYNLDVAASTGSRDLSGFIGANAAWNDRFIDRNGDEFSDLPMQRRATLFGKLDIAPDGISRGGVSTRALFEDRFGGVRGWTASDRGSDDVYGESVLTRRFEAIGQWRFSVGESVSGVGDGLAFDGSWTHHDQRSWYGDGTYDATQRVAFGMLRWGWAGGRHDALVGLSARYQYYDDNTPATEEEPERRFIPGVFLQDEVRVARTFRVLGGARLDHHRAHGAIFSPRLALKWDPAERTTFRLNAGTGFRVVNLFTEDHAALTGAREVVIEEELRPERSRSVSVNLNQVIEFGPNPMMIDLDLFHTRFSNRIMPDYDRDPRLIIYGNLRGYGVTRGASLSLNQNVDFDRFLYTIGVTWQDVFIVEDGEREDAFFAPRFRVVGGATLNLERVPIRVEYTGSVTGAMRLPEYDTPFERATRSPVHGVHNLQATFRMSERGELFVAARNLLDYVQPSPLVDPANAFGDDFDTAWVYGPIRGRHTVVGFRYGVGR